MEGGAREQGCLLVHEVCQEHCVCEAAFVCYRFYCVRIQIVLFLGSNPDVWSFANQSSSDRSAATRVSDLAVMIGRISGKSSSKTLLSFKQLKRYDRASIPAGREVKTKDDMFVDPHVISWSRTTWAPQPSGELRASSSFESNQSVRTARITPEISRALLSRSLLIFSCVALRVVDHPPPQCSAGRRLAGRPSGRIPLGLDGRMKGSQRAAAQQLREKRR
ncbi:homeobox-leucine zipper family protein /lipid-binding START domain-containing protein [Striga asiatica]|uniref:Homeobox-leucine zipper family protein /lipid-binding START domain-containing protein n=1 Tax=Striga asiatica TaxID=4170 RepID=A0A5A7QWD2_STRAF|nr:homeobox-leucine zipper family protein /lipid-binding START domain-containing protein [Striga asiatica]